MSRSAVVIVAEAGDVGAAAVASAAAARLPGHSVEVVQPVELSLATWAHTVRRSGAVETTVTLSRGRRLAGDDLAAVLVRSEATPVPRFSHSDPRDRDYAATELRALLVSWLRSLGERVVNAVDGISLTGPSWTPRRWLAEAHRAGLPVVASVAASSARLVPGWHGSPVSARLPLDTSPSPVWPAPSGTLVIAGGSVTGGAVDQDGRSALLRLADRARCRLVEIDVRLDDGAPRVVAGRAGATLALPLTTDAPAVAAVADLLTSLAQEQR